MNKLNSVDGRRRMASLLVAVLALGHGGCSYTFTTAPPPRTEATPMVTDTPPCSRSYFPPVADTIAGAYFAGLGGLLTLIGVVSRGAESDGTSPSWDPKASHETSNTLLTLGVGTLAIAVVAGLSARYGYSTAHDCRIMYPRPPKQPRRYTY